LGEEIANELVDWSNKVHDTYRTELGRLNELNYARFDTKVKQRLTEFRAVLRREIAERAGDLRDLLAERRAICEP
jgi:hypothetical protein